MVATSAASSQNTRDVLGAVESFAKLGLPDGYRRALLLAGYRRPSPVQEQTIPLIRLGTDLIIQAKSGTGKTLVFALACLERVTVGVSLPQALIISPTREIAQQNSREIQKIANNLPFPNLNCPVFTGGVSVNEDRRRLLRPAQIIVGTPGRLLWLFQRNLLNLNGIRVLVLDEADQLFTSESLKSTVEQLFNALPTARQSLAFSATFSSEAKTSIASYMDYPRHIVIKDSEKPLIGVKQCFKLIPSESSEEEDAIFDRKMSSLLEVFNQVSFHQAVVFCNSKVKAESLLERLNSAGIQSAVTSGRKSQEHRNQTINAMRDFELRVVISTDLYARGVDLKRVNLVINLDLPFDKETYQHRVGRTGRFGTHGLSIALVTESEKDRLEDYCGNSTSTPNEGSSSNVLVPLPEGGAIPIEWYEHKVINQSDQLAFEKLLETPYVVPDATRHFENENQNWIGQISQSEFTLWRDNLEKRNPFWRQWDPYHSHHSLRTQGMRQTEVQSCSAEVRDWISKSPSELSLKSGGSSSRKYNCIRLPLRQSRTTSASSVVYSEEGDCDFEDNTIEDDHQYQDTNHQINDLDVRCEQEQGVDDYEVGCVDASVHELRSPSKSVVLPSFPTELTSLSDFAKVKEEYEKWRQEYMKWHQKYNIWFDDMKHKILDSELPLPPSPLDSKP